jgi:Flp pilus assembly protein TadD
LTYKTSAIAAAFVAAAAIATGQGRSTGPVARWTAKIVLEDGTPLPADPLIALERSGTGDCKIHTVFGNGTVIYSAWMYTGLETTDACPVQIRLEGYRTAHVVLHDGQTVVLKRVGESEGSITSLAAVKAPDAAKKAYNKGAAALRKGNWAAAQQSFEEAVGIYPEYDQAWSDLGEALEHQSKPDEARTAYGKALAASPKYLKPYAQLARLSIGQARYQEALDITARAMALNPLEFPSIYYYDALAHFQLQQTEAAEKSVKRAIELDVDHQMPRALYLLGLILEQKGDRAAALESMRAYAGLSPKPPDVEQVKQHISKLEHDSK